jgi:aspartyl-tRNA(Asn)/glutamyl-tRNA(Gln) amidotransferase subunit A
MEPGVERRVREAVAALEAAGAVVEEVSLPHTDYGLATYYIVAPAEASANLARYDGLRFGPHHAEGDVLANYLATRGRGFGPEVKRRIMLGTYALSAGYYDAYYLKAQKVRTLIKADFDLLWAQGFDALVAPTSSSVAFRFGARLADPVAMYLSDACTLPVNMAGLPGISIPCGLSEGLPVGLQFIGAPWSEAELLGLARGYEGITANAEWRRLEPTELALAAHPATPAPRERIANLPAA